MNDFFVNFAVRTQRNKIIHIKKHVPPGGRVNVSVGHEVGPGDVIGEGQTQIGFRTIHLASVLGVGPKDALASLKPKMNQTIFQGELLAEVKGLLKLGKKVLVSPVDGVVDFIDPKTGDLRLKLIPKRIKLLSGVYGVIDGIGRDGDILIRTLADVIYGCLGSGREREGTLKVIGTAGDLISSKQIVESARGCIVVGGQLIFPEALKKAAAIQVLGLITGGINACDFKGMAGEVKTPVSGLSDVGISLMVTEGFGSIPIGEDIFSILKGHSGKYAVLNGNSSRLILPTGDEQSIIYIRKTRLPLNGSLDERPEKEAVLLKTGQTVRTIGGPKIGFMGVVESIDQAPSKLPSGITSFLVTVLGTKQKIRVPYQNLEVIG